MTRPAVDAPDLRARVRVMGTRIDRVNWEEAIARMARWADRGEARTVCICNVHSVVTSLWNRALRGAIDGADLATPDGWPVAAVLRAKGARGQQRISGPDLMARYLEHAARVGTPLYFYGGTPETLDRLGSELIRRYPSLRISGMESPPFRPLTAEEGAAARARINASGARVLFVSLGCPKQEVWMADQADRVQAVKVGVGAAFDFLAGTVNRAPLAMQRLGLEWLHRLLTDPRRLWNRYLTTNALFVFYLVGVLLVFPAARAVRRVFPKRDETGA